MLDFNEYSLEELDEMDGFTMLSEDTDNEADDQCIIDMYKEVTL